jgi:two-component system chemotaxis response regulator CheB
MPGNDRCFARDIIVVGASAGGVEALCEIASGLLPNLPAAVFVVLHLAPEATSVLPRILERAGPLPAAHPADMQPILPGRFYVAPPDRHLMIGPGVVRVVRGATENRHRPAVDPLFRTAARTYGPRVAGVILTGGGDDGTAGLLEVKRSGGIAVVQDPEEAFCPRMPRSALEFVEVDYRLPLREIAPLLARLCRMPTDPCGTRDRPRPMMEPDSLSPSIEEEISRPENEVMPGPPFGFTCPDCHGHLWEVQDGGLLRFRCRVGHAYTAESLFMGKQQVVESTLWAALNAFEEHGALARRMAAHARERGHDFTAQRMDLRAEEAAQHAGVLRDLLTQAPAPEELEQAEGPELAREPAS